MKKIILFIIFLFTVADLRGQYDEDVVLLLIQGYVIESLSGQGHTHSVVTAIANISSSNPAAVNDFESLSVGLSYQLDSKVEIADMGYQRLYNALPQSGGFVVPFQKIRIGFGVSQKYNSVLDLSGASTFPVYNASGEEVYFEPTHETYIISPSLLVGYTYQSLLEENDKIHFGGQFTYHKLQHNDTFYEADASSSSWSFGVRYDLPVKLELGLYYEKGTRLKGRVHANDSLFAGRIPGTVGPDRRPIIYPEFVTGDLPDKIHPGFLLQRFVNLKIFGNLSNVFWNRTSKYLKDQIEYSGGIVYSPRNRISFSLGFLSTDRTWRDIDRSSISRFFDVNDKYGALFITGGVVVPFKYFDLGLSVADSHLKVEGWREQTIIKLSLSRSF